MSPEHTAAARAGEFVVKLNDIIIFPTIALLSAVGFLVFLFGCFEYFVGAANDQARQKGVKHITYGIIGLVVMVSALAIMELVIATFPPLSNTLDCAQNPTGPGCDDVFDVPDTVGPVT